MNKSILWLIGLLFVTSLSIVSCSETDGTEDPYANWEELISGILTPLLQWRKPIEAMEKGNGKSSVPINFHLWD